MGAMKNKLIKETEARAFDSLIDAAYFEIQEPEYVERKKLEADLAEEQFINEFAKTKPINQQKPEKSKL